ncbi:MAG: Sapep family Mn(2+)-dependent dipeptidase [Oscillospiraceae bacterium]|nr:Sapep family Mn(2+)-dependent dipeptidase [Oscillospiraceae bacterium]
MMNNDPALMRRIDQWFDVHSDELLADLCDLVEIHSTAGKPQPGMPYGEGPAEALACADSMLSGHGLKTDNFENRVLTADLNDNSAALGIIAHLDVVGAGDGWATDPFELSMSEHGEILYGRGVSDDKGPAVAAMYAMYAARELAPDLPKSCRLILGSAEETGMDDLEQYGRANFYPPSVFSPDADYPVINTEKGHFTPAFSASWEESAALPRIVSFTGGTVPNIVPHLASAVLEGSDLQQVQDVCARISGDTGVTFTASLSQDGLITVTACGTASHASVPDKGKNAQSALLAVLVSLPMAECEGFSKLRALSELVPFGDSSGRSLGIEMSDEISGDLTSCFSVFKYGLTGMAGLIDIRTPLCADGSDIDAAVADRFGAAGITADVTHREPGHHTPADSQIVKTLLGIYEDYTGKPGECLAVGGLTYVHSIPGGVAFGCTMPGYESNIHAANECMPLSDLIMSAKMFTMAIIQMCS